MKPQKAGWYWYRDSVAGGVVQVYEAEGLKAAFNGRVEVCELWELPGEWLGEAIPPTDEPTDTQRIDFIAQQLKDRASGFELYPVGCDIEYAEDGNTRISENYWQWLECRGDTFREVIDKAMIELTDNGWPKREWPKREWPKKDAASEP